MTPSEQLPKFEMRWCTEMEQVTRLESVPQPFLGSEDRVSCHILESYSM